MSLSKNIAANYASQVFVISISIVTLPILLKVLGAEAYGLVGFFSMVQSLFALLDLGMSPTMSREIARFRGGALSGNRLRSLYAKLLKVFILVGLLFLVVGILTSDYIASSWLKTETLTIDSAQSSILIIIPIVCLRWLSGYYKAIVSGYEELQWLSAFNAGVGMFRFLIVFAPLYWLSATPVVYFLFQLCVALGELICVIFKSNRLLPTYTTDNKVDSAYLKTAFRFAMTIAFTSAVWVAITQIDKLFLSKMMKLSEYGYYTLAVQLAGGIMLVSGPISSAIVPRMSKLEAEKRHDDLLNVYSTATQFVVVIVGTISLLLVVFSKEVLFAWSMDNTVVSESSKYLYLYAAGNMLLAFSAFPYYLQYAKGDLKMHVIGNILFLIFLLPSLFLVVKNYGGIGAGYVWFGVNIVYFLIWVPMVHNRFDKGLNKRWFGRDVVAIIIPMFAVCMVLKGLTFGYIKDRWINIALLLLDAGIILLTGILCSNHLRKQVFIVLNRLWKS